MVITKPEQVSTYFFLHSIFLCVQSYTSVDASTKDPRMIWMELNIHDSKILRRFDSLEHFYGHNQRVRAQIVVNTTMRDNDSSIIRARGEKWISVVEFTGANRFLVVAKCLEWLLG